MRYQGVLRHRFFVDGIHAARLHKCGEETGAGRFLQVDFFGMELRGYYEAAAIHLEHFGDPVVSRPADDHVPARLMHRLVMEAVHHEGAWTKQLLNAAAGQDIDAVCQVIARQVSM
jgi:hypothetical protein